MNEAQKQIRTQKEEFEAAASFLMDLVPIKNGKLLDVGCGIGWVVNEANDRGFMSLGIDKKKSYIDAGKKYLRINLQASSLEGFKTREKFEVVILKHVLEHIIDPESFLKKIRSFLTPGGVYHCFLSKHAFSYV